MSLAILKRGLRPDSLMSGSTSMAEVPPARGASAFSFGRFFGPILYGLVGSVCVLLTIDVGNSHPRLAQGPGLTFDEGFNVETGVYLVRAIRQYGWGAVHPVSLMEIFSNPAYNPDHPPFGRLILGAAHELSRALFGDPVPIQREYSVTFARIGSALCFGVTILVASWAAATWFGTRAGLFAALCLLLTPRALGHAHLAALETAMGMTYLIVLVQVANSWGRKDRLRWRDGLLPGILLGLAFLTKIQAVLLPPVIVAWALWNWRRRAVLPLIVMGVAAFVVFFVGWPWLWLDPLSHVKEYFLRATDRQTVYCYYLGERFADRNVPWHYPFLMFLTTTPVLLLLFAGWGIWRMQDGGSMKIGPMSNADGRKDVPSTSDPRRSTGASFVRSPASFLMLLATLAPLLLFVLPGVAVYDGARLFLVAWPPLAVVMGRGAGAVWMSLRKRFSFLLHSVITILAITVTAVPILLMHPCQLSYYNVLAGWLPGAEKLGMEVSYWGDGVTAQFLDEGLKGIPQGATIDVAPVLHPLQLEFMRTQQIAPLRPDLKLRGFDTGHLDDVSYVIAVHRRADTWEILKSPPENWQVIAQTRRMGVPLATLYKVP